MPRCRICDYCSEIDGTDGRKYNWREDKLGYECNKCQRESVRNFNAFYDGEVAWVDQEYDDLERDEFLEDSDLEANSGDSG